MGHFFWFFEKIIAAAANAVAAIARYLDLEDGAAQSVFAGEQIIGGDAKDLGQADHHV